MEAIYIDINCDVGEGIGNEKSLMPLISSCNIACGGHAGDLETISEVTKLAKVHGVKVGAHPSYPDRDNFGRVSVDISQKELITSIRRQMDDFMTVLKRENITLHHIKPHGALYNDISKNPDLAETFLKAIEDFKNTGWIYVPYKSAIEVAALKNGFQIKREAFADRNYNSDLSLVSRQLPGAVLEAPEEVLQHLVNMVTTQNVTTSEGEKAKIIADTFCVHGDTPSALEILNYLSRELPKANIRIAK